MLTPLSERARGRWVGLLPLLGVDSRFLTNKQGPCPICAGKTRFRFDDRDGRGTWICNHCGAGDGAELVKRVLGIDYREVAIRCEGLIDGVPYRAPQPERSPDACREGLARLWRNTLPVKGGDPVARYLWNRVGMRAAPTCLRTANRLLYKDEVSTWHPAMVALMAGPDGRPVMLHRTFLTEDGRKADVEAPRRFMPGSVPDGSAVRLFDSGPTLGIAEGIETALAAASLFGIPVWAALNSTLLAKWTAPDDVEEAIVFGDADARFGGQAAAYALAHRLSRDVPTVRVEIPAEIGTDWCDVLCGEKAAA